MEKIYASVSDLVLKVSEEIAKDNQYVLSLDAIVESANKIVSCKKTRCKGKLKNGKPCRNMAKLGEEYCLRHTPLSDDDNDLNDEHNNNKTEIDVPQCLAITDSGHRCIRNTIMGEDYCGIHKLQIKMNKRKSNMYKCIHYKEKEDGRVFCSKYARPNLWFCKKHMHMQKIYEKDYKSCSHANYKELVDKQEIPKITFLEKYVFN